MLRVTTIFISLCILQANAQVPGKRGLVGSPTATNTALLVGVSHGLPGIDLDIQYVKSIASEDAYRFDVSELHDNQGTIRNVEIELAKSAMLAHRDGSLLFYFSGHGTVDKIYLQDGLLSVSRLRAAIEKGREQLGPLARLVLIFDSCYSGSLLGPFNRLMPDLASYDPQTASRSFAQTIASEFAGNRRDYWEKIFVFASSRADETSLAGSNGSVFTVALNKAFEEVMEVNGTMREWVERTKKYTQGHHPVERMVPASLMDEAMDPN